MDISGVSVVCFNQLGPQEQTWSMSWLAKELGLVNVIVCIYVSLAVSHGLRTPNEAFFHQNSKLLGLDRLIGQKFWAFGVFSADL